MLARAGYRSGSFTDALVIRGPAPAGVATHPRLARGSGCRLQGRTRIKKFHASTVIGEGLVPVLVQPHEAETEDERIESGQGVNQIVASRAKAMFEELAEVLASTASAGEAGVVVLTGRRQPVAGSPTPPASLAARAPGASGGVQGSRSASQTRIRCARGLSPVTPRTPPRVSFPSVAIQGRRSSRRVPLAPREFLTKRGRGVRAHMEITMPISISVPEDLDFKPRITVEG